MKNQLCRCGCGGTTTVVKETDGNVTYIHNKPSYFPIKIALSHNNKVQVIETPENIPAGIAFTVLETRVGV